MATKRSATRRNSARNSSNNPVSPGKGYNVNEEGPFTSSYENSDNYTEDVNSFDEARFYQLMDSFTMNHVKIFSRLDEINTKLTEVLSSINDISSRISTLEEKY
ncbi:MAG: hypothetical protein ACI4N3_04355 [Alphaproteobacteria bacterium]